MVYKTVKIITKEDGTIDENKRMMLLIKEIDEKQFKKDINKYKYMKTFIWNHRTT